MQLLQRLLLTLILRYLQFLYDTVIVGITAVGTDDFARALDVEQSLSCLDRVETIRDRDYC